jgi:hypothetical protein
MQKACVTLMQNGAKPVGPVLLFFEERRLESGDIEIMGAFSVPREASLSTQPYQFQIEDGRKGELVIENVNLTSEGNRKAGFIGGIES